MSTKKEKAKFVVEALETLYPETPIPLDHKDPYTLLIAVLLSAQCTDARVNTVTPHLFALADNPFDMAQQPVERIQEIIRPCGLSPKKLLLFPRYLKYWSINIKARCQKVTKH